MLNEEPAQSQDLQMMGMLLPLGIEKGKDFKPDVARFGRNRTNVWNYAGANGFPRDLLSCQCRHAAAGRPKIDFAGQEPRHRSHAMQSAAADEAIRRKVRFGCPSWTLIELCALRRSRILGASWKTFGRCSWPHRIKA